MRKIFRRLLNLFSEKTIIFLNRKTLAQGMQNPKNDNKAYLKMPMAFDFTAYFDDNELENNAEDIPHENKPAETDIKTLCVIDEKCNKMLYSFKSQQFECCIN